MNSHVGSHHAVSDYTEVIIVCWTQCLFRVVGGTLAALALSVIILLIGIVVMALVCGRKSKTAPSVESAQVSVCVL